MILAKIAPLIFRIPKDRINWTTSSFLIGTFVLTLTAVPLYLWYFGVDWFHFAFFACCLPQPASASRSVIIDCLRT